MHGRTQDIRTAFMDTHDVLQSLQQFKRHLYSSKAYRLCKHPPARLSLAHRDCPAIQAAALMAARQSKDAELSLGTQGVLQPFKQQLT